jgi:hypothetical protein
MKALIFTLLIALSFVLEIIMVNMSKDISRSTPQIISIFLLSLSLVSTLGTFIIWGINPCQHSIKLPTITISLNVTIKLISTIIFSIFYYTENYVSSSYVIFSYLSLILSFALPFVFEVNTTPATIAPQQGPWVIQEAHIQQGVHQEIDKPDIKITIFTSDEPSSCTICLEDFEEGENINETNCGHFFHKNCMEKILNNKIKNCPVCRRDLREEILNI